MHKLWQLGGKLGSRNKLSILIYHQVMAVADPMRPSEPDAKRFEWQMALLRKYFTPVSLPDAVVMLREQRLPANAVCITFDDGYLDNLTVALPILKKYQIPATVFVATAFSEGVNMWNDRLIDLIGDPSLTSLSLNAMDLPAMPLDDIDSRQQAVKTLIPLIKYQDFRQRQTLLDGLLAENQRTDSAPKMMTPTQVRELSDAGVNIGAHTVDHPIMKVQDEAEQLRQLTVCKETLEQWLDKPVTGFAYPNGRPDTDYDSTSVMQVKKAGFEHAVSTRWGINTPSTDPYQLNRFTPWDHSQSKFHLRLVLNQLLSKA
ncbi:polysaccharide deacetylase family protein [Aestuariibacter halophilus]|uniref:Polysaccharide deacetylase family protein n=1 Tax=Fluctibacter halophilus TaxID=226011 RepID=A0ABS8G2S1_9ALTE|nr:polysaccharide deacetylase family protein [Aestuariibacter halophilus]MCC2614872.1 polysaccharide deacetylase family protein [Aestuariibacter halophilus]